MPKSKHVRRSGEKKALDASGADWGGHVPGLVVDLRNRGAKYAE